MDNIIYGKISVDLACGHAETHTVYGTIGDRASARLKIESRTCSGCGSHRVTKIALGDEGRIMPTDPYFYLFLKRKREARARLIATLASRQG